MNSSHIACSICGRVKAHRSDRPPYCPDCKRHADALRVGEWVESAACRDVQNDPDWWFADKDNPMATALALNICWKCPVCSECLAYALSNDETVGVWGGKRADERARLVRAS